MARGQLGRRRRTRRRACPLEPRDRPPPAGSTCLRRLPYRGGPRQHRPGPRACGHRAGAGRSPAGLELSAALCRWVLGQLELSADDPAAALGWLEPVADMLQAGGFGEPGRYPVHPRPDRGVGGDRPAGPRGRPAGLAAGRGAAAGSPLGADHRRPRRSRPAARPARPGRGGRGRRRCHSRGAAAGAAVRAGPLPAGAGHRAAQGPPAPRRRRLPRRGRSPPSAAWAPRGGRRWPRRSGPGSRPDPATP